MKAGELPIILECEKRQLTYLWILLISEHQLNDILDIQLKAYKSNTSCFANHVLNLLKKYDVKESLSYIASLSKNKWEKLLQKKSVKFNIEYCTKKKIN